MLLVDWNYYSFFLACFLYGVAHKLPSGFIGLQDLGDSIKEYDVSSYNWNEF